MASAGWERRNAAARAAGYESYYDYRVHGYGARPASAPVTSEDREQYRGHRSLGDLMRLVDRVGPGEIQVAPLGTQRNSRGRWTQVEVDVRFADGRERRFVLRGRQASAANLEALKGALSGSGITYLASPSIDVFSDVEASDDAAAEG